MDEKIPFTLGRRKIISKKYIDIDVNINTYSKKHIKIHIVKKTPKKQRRLEQFERHFFS